ncbi:MAG: hypothetical protein QOD07_541 [Frankiaceae bacterium]|jgi:hypothetical protein|nr:hypothetical protein [Frankiaceae bacterium]
MWGGGIPHQPLTPEERRKARRQLAWMLPTMYLPTALAGLLTWVSGASGSVVAVVAIGAFLLTFLVAIVVAAVVEVRRSHPASRCHGSREQPS